MKVVAHNADLGGCGFYRVIWPSEALAKQGHDVTWEWDTTYRCQWRDTIAGPTLIGLDEQVDADVVVLQRPLTRNRFELVKALQDQGVAVVIEIDDDFHSIHRRNPAWRYANPLRDKDAHRDWLLRACEVADLVTCTTRALARRYAPHGRVAILDNYVPASYLDIERDEHGSVIVGWSGSTITHPGDLEVTEGGVAAAVTAHGARLAVVGTGTGVAEGLGYGSGLASTGWLPLEGYPGALARLDVGVVPLLGSDFNEAKSHLKGLEFASVGVPFVATPTGPYRALAEKGIGWLADSPADWRYLVGELIQDHEHRQALSEQWRAEVAKNWTVEQHASKWWAAWECAYAHRQERIAA